MEIKKKYSFSYIGEKFNTQYPYAFRVELAGESELPNSIITNRTTEINNDLIDWLEETAIPCTIAGSGLYLKTEEDLSMFLLRWSGANSN